MTMYRPDTAHSHVAALSELDSNDPSNAPSGRPYTHYVPSAAGEMKALHEKTLRIFNQEAWVKPMEEAMKKLERRHQASFEDIRICYGKLLQSMNDAISMHEDKYSGLEEYCKKVDAENKALHSRSLGEAKSRQHYSTEDRTPNSDFGNDPRSVSVVSNRSSLDGADYASDGRPVLPPDHFYSPPVTIASDDGSIREGSSSITAAQGGSQINRDGHVTHPGTSNDPKKYFFKGTRDRVQKGHVWTAAKRLGSKVKGRLRAGRKGGRRKAHPQQGAAKGGEVEPGDICPSPDIPRTRYS
ncbi:hypothetical protein QFC22_003812 [Naganishia vaughanmartiniae]|uniref:Uncharacterized protein n=1 Tax=Naganishia vaughanmartiniae TaxID=1424756 RepID=A0ACC2X758_9TREE|nr:hypothetical protein QFC22_003812 [Naganishia vaughanmartiniae]